MHPPPPGWASVRGAAGKRELRRGSSSEAPPKATTSASPAAAPAATPLEPDDLVDFVPSDSFGRGPAAPCLAFHGGHVTLAGQPSLLFGPQGGALEFLVRPQASTGRQVRASPLYAALRFCVHFTVAVSHRAACRIVPPSAPPYRRHSTDILSFWSCGVGQVLWRTGTEGCRYGFEVAVVDLRVQVEVNSVGTVATAAPAVTPLQWQQLAVSFAAGVGKASPTVTVFVNGSCVWAVVVFTFVRRWRPRMSCRLGACQLPLPPLPPSAMVPHSS